MKKYFPVMLDITDKKCIIIGGGKVAFRKTKSLLEYNSEIILISKYLCKDLEDLLKNSSIVYVPRNYEYGDLKDAFLVFAATDDKEINAKIQQEAENAGILANIVDLPEKCSFIVPSKVESGDLTISVSTNGKSPMLTKKIRQDLEKIYDVYYGQFVDILGDFRQKSIDAIKDAKDRENFFEEVVSSDFLEKIKAGNLEQVSFEINKIFENYIQKGDKR